MANWDLWPVHAFVDALAAAGVKAAVVSPGSRNTPLTLAFAEHPEIAVYSHLDERSAGFFALGLAKSTGVPVVLCCTSGTATANYYPAVMEAFEARVPLLVVTADRPHQLRDVGANQAVRQPGMYAMHVKWALELPVPDGTQELARHAAAMAARATAVALAAPAGPVHVNYPFVEPLMLPPRAELTDAHQISIPSLYRSAQALPDASGVEALYHALQTAKRPMFVIGPQPSAEMGRAVASFCAKHGIVLCADVLSQARFVPGEEAKTQVQYFDLLLTAVGDTMPAPDLVVRFGGQPTSKSMSTFLQHAAKGARVFVADESEWYRDASFVATDVIAGDVLALLRDLAGRGLEPKATWDLYVQAWKQADEAVASVVATFTKAHWFEGAALRSFVAALPEGAQLFIGNSRPIRDLDALASPRPPIVAYGNRGVSGIDGIVSTAFGVAAGRPTEPTVLCLGDVSFYHDLNGLLAARRFSVPLTILLVHNDGGGIFQHLSQAQRQETLGYFTTPHGLEFEEMVNAYGGRFTRVTDEMALAAATRQATSRQNGLQVIEVRFDNAESAGLYQRLRQEVASALRMVMD
ncbi:2-succinyl-5-enolpyruvyl-6-hydroxy-3-cyclohexene-1-carboxylic-acid synthase [Alicyclobacillus acidoterrestris]|uniref:2-succinyl-5-enolpyruvyl-6-hydroxy-3- cyclohexene-1-carboxylic-acid synthase n=1 Tax=Alicyclobacillus acidoterrestris TaxID=1450 RepID=UPI003F538BE3